MSGPSEHDEQASLIQEANLRAGADPRWGLLLAIPNGGLRSKATAAKLKAEGVRAGVPDLFLPVASRGMHGLWIEMKRGDGGQISAAQKEWHIALQAQGYGVAICPGADSAVWAIRMYLDGAA